MFDIFREEIVITVCMGLFFLSSVLCRVLLGGLYRRMIRETDNMATTENKLLRQCKLKFTNCYQMNRGIPNIPVFVDKFLSRLSVGPFSFEMLYHLSGQLMLLSVVCSGIGVCRSVIAGRMLGEILPFYIISFLELYFYFSVSTMTDIKGYRRILKINLVDYLENHLSMRMDVTDRDMERLYGKQIRLMPINGRGGRSPDAVKAEAIKSDAVKKETIKNDAVKAEARQAPSAEEEKGLTRAQEKELETLLTEFLTT